MKLSYFVACTLAGAAAATKCVVIQATVNDDDINNIHGSFTADCDNPLMKANFKMGLYRGTERKSDWIEQEVAIDPASGTKTFTGSFAFPADKVKDFGFVHVCIEHIGTDREGTPSKTRKDCFNGPNAQRANAAVNAAMNDMKAMQCRTCVNSCLSNPTNSVVPPNTFSCKSSCPSCVGVTMV